MRLLVANSVYEYVAAIRTLAQLPEQTPGTVLPVYASWRKEPASWELFPAHVFEEEAVASSSIDDSLPHPAVLAEELLSGQSQHVVIGLQGSAYAYTAVLHAYMTNRAFVFVENVDGLIQWLQSCFLSTDATITICVEQEFLEQRMLNRLFAAVSQNFLSDRPVLRSAIGFLTAPHGGALSFLLLKTYCYPLTPGSAKPLLVVPFASRNTLPPAETYDLLCREDSSAESLQALLDKPRRAVAFYSHSHEDCIFLGTDIIEVAGSPFFGERLSHLAPGHGQKASAAISLSTASVRCQVLLANMCTGIKFVNGLYSSAENIGLGFVTGWPACYIAPTTVKNDITPEAILFLHLMSAGCSVGESMRALNAVLANLSSDPQVYVLVGDPLVRIAPTARILPSLAMQVQEEMVSVRVDLPETTTTSLIRVIHPQVSAWIKAGSCYLTAIEVAGEAPKKLNVDYLLLPSDQPDELLLILFSPSALASGCIYLMLTALAPLSDLEAAQLEQCLFQVEHLMLLSLFPHKAAGIYTELGNMVKNTVLFMQARHTVAAYQKARQQATKMLLLLENLQKEVLASLADRLSRGTLAFTDRYINQTLATDCFWIEPACACGEPLYHKKLVHAIRHAVERHVLVCPRCGIISDSPANGVTGEIIGFPTFAHGEVTTLQLSLHNATECDVTCQVAMALEYAKFMGGDCEVNPPQVTLTMHAGTTETVSFAMTCGTDVMRGVYFLKTLIIYNMHLIALHRPISIE